MEDKKNMLLKLDKKFFWEIRDFRNNLEKKQNKIFTTWEEFFKELYNMTKKKL